MTTLTLPSDCAVAAAVGDDRGLMMSARAVDRCFRLNSFADT